MNLSAGSPEVNGTCTNEALTRLTPRHLAEFRESGLSDAQIAACEFYSLKAPGSIQAALRKRNTGDLGDCICIPFIDAEGKATGYCRLKPDKPRKGKDGKLVKYESPCGSSNRA